jgi:hypothetical protein
MYLRALAFLLFLAQVVLAQQPTRSRPESDASSVFVTSPAENLSP